MVDWRRPYFEPHRDPSHDIKKLEQWRRNGSLKLNIKNKPKLPRWLIFVSLMGIVLILWFCFKGN